MTNAQKLREIEEKRKARNRGQALDCLHKAFDARSTPVSEDLTLTTYDGNEPLYDYDYGYTPYGLNGNKDYYDQIRKLGFDVMRLTDESCCIEVYDDIMARTGEHEWCRFEELDPNVKPEQVTRLWHIEWSHKRPKGTVWQSIPQWDDDAGNVFHSKLDAFIWLYSKAFSGQIWDDKYKLSIK